MASVRRLPEESRQYINLAAPLEACLGVLRGGNGQHIGLEFVREPLKDSYSETMLPISLVQNFAA
jgi:hypothetical protein